MHKHLELESAEALIFDCDGTLADSMPQHYRAWCAALSPHQFHFDEREFYSLGGTPTGKIVEILNNKHNLRLSIPDIVREKEAHYITLIPEVQRIDCVVNIATEHAGKKPMAVGTGGMRHIVDRCLESIGLASLFPIIITPESVKNGKPAPDTFFAAAENLGAEPKKCVVFEDTEPGVAAARAAGMGCVLVHSKTVGAVRSFQLERLF